jgi:hypothetical protein
MAKTTLVIRHHDSPSFVDEVTRAYFHSSGVPDKNALDSMLGSSLLTHVVETYSRVAEVE